MRATRMLAVRVALLVGASLGLSPSASAQEPEFHHLQGGLINKVFFLDEDRGWTVEDGSRIRYTEDGGETWGNADTPPDVRVDLFGIYMTGTNSAWICGDGGVILQAETDSSGHNWIEATSGDPMNFTRITDQLVDSRYSCGEHPAKLQAIFMKDATHGVVVGYDGAIAVTDDGWQSWNRPAGLPGDFSCEESDPVDIYDIHLFYDTEGTTHYQKGIMCGDNRKYYLTADGGSTWELHQVTGCKPLYVELWRMRFVDPLDPSSEGWMVGGFTTQSGDL